MTMLKIKHNGLEFSAGFRDLGRVQRKALGRALNRVGTTVRKEVTQKIREDYKIKAKDLKSQIKITRATSSQLVVEVSSKTRRIPLGLFTISQMKGGVRAILGKGKKLFIPGAFVAKLKPSQERKGAYIRKGKKRIPTRTLVGPSISQLLGSRFITKLIEKVIKKRLPIEFEREVMFEARKKIK